MSLKLNTASGGSITLQETDTASNVTLTVPAATATLLTGSSDLTTQVKTATNASGSAPIYACRAWVNFNGTGTVAIRASGNVSSITDNGTGDYTVNITTALPDSDYCVALSHATSYGVTTQIAASSSSASPTTQSTTQVRITHRETGGSSLDIANQHVSIIR